MDVFSKAIISFFLIEWLLSITVANIGLYGLNTPSFKASALMILNVCFFFVGFNLVKVNQQNQSNSVYYSISTIVERISHSKIFLLILFASIIYLFILFQQAKELLLMQSAMELRGMYFSDELYGKNYGNLNYFILNQYDIIIRFLFAWKVINKRDWVTIVMGVFLFLHASLDFGRFSYFLILFTIVFVWFIKYKSIKLNIRMLVYTSLGMVLFYLLILYSTSIKYDRNTFDQDNMEDVNVQFISYFAGPIAAFDYSLSDDYVAKIGGYQYGALTFAAPVQALYDIFYRFGIVIEQPFLNLNELVQKTNIDIGSKWGTWNAFYTEVIYFYCDLGVFGVILFSLLFGLMTRTLLRLLYKSRSFYATVLLSDVFIAIALSPIRSYIFHGPHFVFLLVLYIIAKRTEPRFMKV